MADKDLVKAIGEKYAKMSRQKRVKTIRGLSQPGLNFIEKFFPKFYAEAFPAPMAGAPWESAPQHALFAKTR
jgi:hypothetical protein